MICKAFRFDDMHGVAVIGFANPLPLKDLVVFLFRLHPPRGIVRKQTSRVNLLSYINLFLVCFSVCLRGDRNKNLVDGLSKRLTSIRFCDIINARKRVSYEKTS